MPLEDLVEYFNDRFGQEHRCSFSPFIMEAGKVSGLFGQIRISSDLVPLRQALKPTVVIGYGAQIRVDTYKNQHLYSNVVNNLLTDNLLTDNRSQPTDFESIINFDRLCRTVHMLNYLSLTRPQGILFLEVDPLHILGIKQDHGAYFEEVISQCGLQTGNIVIVMTVNNLYGQYYQGLVRGLDNYRRRGYRIALKFDYLNQESRAVDYVLNLSPDYISLSARNLDQQCDHAMLAKLKGLVASKGGQSILQQVDHKESDSLARNIGFDLVEGGYYRAIAFDFLAAGHSS